MKLLLRNLRLAAVAFLILALLLLAGIVVQQRRSRRMFWGHEGENKLALRERYAKAGSILSRNGVILAGSREGERHYAEDPLLAAALVQLIGDYSHNISNTVEERYQNELNGSGRNLLEEIYYDFTGRGRSGDSLRLSLDEVLCHEAAELLTPYRGSMVLLDADNGEVLVMVNAPGVAPEQVVAWEDIPEGSLFNRALMGSYSPGSTFKIVTDTAYIDSPAFDPEMSVHCRGTEALLGPGSVNELRADAGHGTVNRRSAFALSCNHFFGAAGIAAGYDALLKTAASFGYNCRLELDALSANGAKFSSPNRDDYVLSWLSIGQPVEAAVLEISPLALAMMAEAPLKEGQIMKPRLLLERSAVLGIWQKSGNAESFCRAGSPQSMQLLAEDMVYSAENGLARSCQVPGYVIGGKTGTAQFTDEQGELQNNSLFCGFLNHSKKKLALAIVIEGESIDVSALAGSIFRRAVENYQLEP